MKNILTDQDIKDYNDYGMIIKTGFFPIEDINAFKIQLQNMVRYFLKKASSSLKKDFTIKKGEEISKGVMLLESLDHEYVRELSDYIKLMPAVHKFTSNPKLVDMSNILMRKEKNNPIFTTNNGVLVVMPNDDEHSYSWNKEHFTTVPFSEYIQFWSPLIEDSTVELGALKICEKSHKNGWKGQKYIPHKRMSKSFVIPEEELEKYSVRDVEMKLGDLLIMAPGLIHRSGDNTSNRFRFSYVSIFHNICNEKIRPPVLRYEWQGKTPIDYYNELYNKK